MNDAERERWVVNDEYLYQWWQATGESMRMFVRTRRAKLTEYINEQLAKGGNDR